MNQIGPDYLDYYTGIGFNWQQYAGSKVLTIGGLDAYAYVDHVASTYTGEYLDHGVRVNSVFSSYRLAGGGWLVRFFWRETLPLFTHHSQGPTYW